MPDQVRGKLVLVVGPSGAGKDSLIAGARQALADDTRFCFPRRLVTRTAIADLEDHQTISREHFEALRAAGDYFLCWEAHGLGYVLPSSIAGDLSAGHVTVLNVSRSVLAEAGARFTPCEIVLVTADRNLRAQRLALRGRETPEEILARLERDAPPVPGGLTPHVVDNSGSLPDGIALMAALLRRLAGSA
ncbi:MAG TPA: phosphonate metabolism protein/1,5-bisphosphokinase (PRPP-forming) PhnN [Devosiaceae bacterium]